MQDINVAYDNEFDYQSNEEAVSDSRHITHNSKNADRGSTAKIVMLAFAALVLLFCVVYGKVQISDMYSQINAQKSELTVMESENARLKAEIEAHTSLKNIEDYAETIGLKKLDKAQIWYVDIQNDDVVRIPEKDDNFFVQIRKSIMSVLDSFECFIN